MICFLQRILCYNKEKAKKEILMKKPFILITDRYSGLTKAGVNLLAGTVATQLGYTVLPVLTCEEVTDALLAENTVIAVGRTKTHPILKKYEEKGALRIPDKAEGYTIRVGNDAADKEKKIVLIAGADEAGVLYGCADFCNKYLARLMGEGDYYRDGHFDRLFDVDLPDFSLSTAPSIPTRALWTWGHMIYDYRGFFDNMARLRFNEAVIWNDRCPINAEDIISYAHARGVRIVWGYTWGWDNSSKLEKIVAESNAETLARIKEKAIDTFEKEYKGLGDGIYFQSFTEMCKEDVNGNSVADLVVRLVNETAGELLSRYPDLHIQFGLHATSVKTKTKIIARVDPRVYIVWEDCGAFPYSYRSYETMDAEQTLDLTERIVTLRGAEERFGTVLKGMVCLNWGEFEHFSHPYVMGEYPKDFVLRRTEKKRPLWKHVTAGWLRNAELARKTVSTIARLGNAPIVEALVEDGCFEGEAALPVVMLAEMLWDPERNAGEIMETAAAYPNI